MDSRAPRAAPWHNGVCPVSQPEGNPVPGWRHRAGCVRTAGGGADPPSSVGHGPVGGQNAKPWGGETAGRGVKVTPAVTDTHGPQER